MIQSAAMLDDFFDPTPEQQKVVLIDAATLREAERLIESCEGCQPGLCSRPLLSVSCGRLGSREKTVSLGCRVIESRV